LSERDAGLARPYAEEAKIKEGLTQAGTGMNPCLTNICNQRGALRATINAS
jgi:hypothetical protein